jgi:hypothetical protein
MAGRAIRATGNAGNQQQRKHRNADHKQESLEAE